MLRLTDQEMTVIEKSLLYSQIQIGMGMPCYWRIECGTWKALRQGKQVLDWLVRIISMGSRV